MTSNLPSNVSGIDQTPINPSFARKMWQNLAIKNKPQLKTIDIPQIKKNQKPQYNEFSQQTSPLLESHNSESKEQPKVLPENRESFQPEIDILDTLYSEPSYRQSVISNRVSVPNLKKTNSEVCRQTYKSGQKSNSSEVVSANRESTDINILDSIVKSNKQQQTQQKQWQQEILEELETQNYLLQASYQGQISDKPEQSHHQSQPQINKNLPSKFLIFPPVIQHNYQHQFQITRSLGYIFSEILEKSYNFTPVGYQKWCQDLIMDDHIYHHMKRTRKSSQHIEVRKRSLPISVIFSFAMILSIPIPEEIQSLQLHQFVTIAETTTNQ